MQGLGLGQALQISRKNSRCGSARLFGSDFGSHFLKFCVKCSQNSFIVLF